MAPVLAHLRPSSNASATEIRALTSRAGRIFVAAWTLGVALYLLPGPLANLLRRQELVARQPALPTINAPTPVAGPDPVPKTPRAGPAVSPQNAGGQPIEDPSGSMAHFARALRAAKSSAGTSSAATSAVGARVRVLHYGDSQIDLDYISGHLRKRMQQCHGDGGFGTTPALKPWRWFYQPKLSHSASPGWTLYRIAGAPRPDGYLGLGLAAAALKADKGWLRVASAGRSTHIELSYLAQPGGGTLLFWVQGQPTQRVRTASKTFHVGYLELTVPEGKHVVQVSARGRVRLLNLVFERERGLTWENLPMLSARFHRLTTMSSKLWKAQLAHRAPALVVFQYGANDALGYGGSLDSYEKRVTKVLRWRREALPKSSCLVIGPLDQVVRKNGTLVPRKTVGGIIKAQRRAATAQGCAFWDARQAMGGKGSLRSWIKAGRMRHDFVHLNPKGAAELSRLLYVALEQAIGRATTKKPER